MSALERRLREREDMRQLILNTASELIREAGFEKLTMRKVAERMEYTPMALYNHFADKDAILKALADEGFGRFLRAHPRRRALPPVAQLRRNLLDYIQYAIRNPEQYRLIFMTQRSRQKSTLSRGRQTVDVIPEGSGRLAFERLVESVRDCAGEFPVFDDAFTVALFLWTAIHGAASLLITLTQFPFGSPKTYAETTVEYLLSGLLASNAVKINPARHTRNDRVLLPPV